MWLPEYGTNMYYNVDAVQEEGDALEITTTFYREKAKSTLLCKTVISVGIEDGKPVILRLKTG